MTGSFVQNRLLSLVVSPPLWSDDSIVLKGRAVPTRFIDDQLGFHAGNLHMEKTAWGGYWVLTFQVNGRQTDIEEWLEEGMGRHVQVYDPALCLVWEGFVNTVAANIGSLSLSMGPLLSSVSNKVKVVYSTVDYTFVPPAVGVRDSSDWANDLDSQERYGVIEEVVNVGGVSIDEVDQLRDTALSDYAWPRPRETDNLGSSSHPTATITCLGYVNWLQAYTFSSLTAGLQDVDAKVEAVLAQDPNSIFSTDYTRIDSNTAQVGAWEQRDPTAWGVIKGITALGEAVAEGYDRWLFYLGPGRIPFFHAVPTDVAYQRQLSDVEQKVEKYGSGARVEPWDVDAGKLSFYTDLMIGRKQETDVRIDPRHMFIEKAAVSLPWALNLEGSRVGDMAQLMARMGLAGRAG